MKKTILLLCAAIWIMLAGCTKSGTMGSLTWKLKNGTLTISGTGAMPDSNYFVYPWEPYHTSIQTVGIKEGVTSIGREAFSYCNALTSISIPNSVTSIGERIFYECGGLKKVIVEWEQPIFIDCPTYSEFPTICILEVPQGTKALYENEYGYSYHIVESTCPQ
jgi:hypothetical protein